MVLSVFRCSKIYNFQNLCGIQYVPLVWLEMTSNLDDHSTSLVNMVTTNGKKNFKQLHDNVSRRERYPD